MAPLTPEDPSTVGPYRLQGRLGWGGMGTVYLAHGPDGRTVALKLIRSELALAPEFRSRFAGEVANARRVADFCTARVLDHGTFDGRPYLVTEFVQGPSLADALESGGPLESRSLHGLATGIATALTAIHAVNLVHRDLKPGNVLLSATGPRIIDFGIARALDGPNHHTQTGLVVGSAGWIAPEQVFDGTVTPAADIFTWGVTRRVRRHRAPSVRDRQPHGARGARPSGRARSARPRRRAAAFPGDQGAEPRPGQAAYRSGPSRRLRRGRRPAYGRAPGHRAVDGRCPGALRRRAGRLRRLRSRPDCTSAACPQYARPSRRRPSPSSRPMREQRTAMRNGTGDTPAPGPMDPGSYADVPGIGDEAFSYTYKDTGAPGSSAHVVARLGNAILEVDYTGSDRKHVTVGTDTQIPVKQELEDARAVAREALQNLRACSTCLR